MLVVGSDKYLKYLVIAEAKQGARVIAMIVNNVQPESRRIPQHKSPRLIQV